MTEQKEKKSKYQALEEKLLYKNDSIWQSISHSEENEMSNISNEYMDYISKCKTERESVIYLQNKAINAGYKNILDFKGKAKTNDKFYWNFRDKVLAIIKIGEDINFNNGINIVGAHSDSPRLDLKQNPLYEDSGFALFKTHYYGGIKKYQWLNIPLALHGVVILENGKKIEINIGEKDDDPVFVISDLLPHLSRNVQGDKKISEAISAENMVVIVGSRPVKDKLVKEKVKLNVLEYLYNNYGIKEEDFISSEIEVVPAFKAREIGFDRSIIGAYGHDDRVCSYLAVSSLISNSNIKKTGVALIVDKEEIGSSGSTGSDSYFIHHLYSIIANAINGENLSFSDLRKSFLNSNCISSDVAAAINPPYKQVHDLQNAAKLGYGVAITKYTGSGGKYSANDADAEYVGKIRGLLNSHKIPWQYAMLGKVDEGGGGTIAKYVAYYGINTIDAGVPVVGMHSPFELISKADLWATYKFYSSFFAEFLV
ncbi:MAG: aminopeptidase [Spirochaetota bacterium]